MAVKRISAEALIDLAVAALRRDLAPALPDDKRYLAAMTGNALEIARREVVADAEAPLWKLLDTLYDDGDGSAKQLALDIRNGVLAGPKFEALGASLLAVIEAELAISNPRFLAENRRRAKA